MVGTVPLTRAVLGSSHVRHEVALTDDGAIDVNADPMGLLLMALQNHNHLCCDILSAEGCDGDQFCTNAPIQGLNNRSAKVTIHRTRERQDAFQKGRSSAGKLFISTGGCHLSEEDAFIGWEHAARQSEIAELEKGKKSIIAQRRLYDSAKAIMEESVGIAIASLSVAKIRTLLKWKLQGQTPKGRKDQLVLQYTTLSEPAIPAWTEVQENRYLFLTSEDISIQDTALGREREAMAETVVANIDHISGNAFERLKHVVHQQMRKEYNNGNDEEHPLSLDDGNSNSSIDGDMDGVSI